jgi:hypothetical protein
VPRWSFKGKIEVTEYINRFEGTVRYLPFAEFLSVKYLCESAFFGLAGQVRPPPAPARSRSRHTAFMHCP